MGGPEGMDRMCFLPQAKQAICQEVMRNTFHTQAAAASAEMHAPAKKAIGRLVHHARAQDRLQTIS